MNDQKRQINSIIRAGNLSRMVMAAVFTWSSAVYPAMAQTPEAPTPPPADAAPATPVPQVAPETVPPVPPAAAVVPPAAPTPVYSMTDLQFLLEPIALYPDPLLALILPASTFPDQLIEAEEWIIANEAAVKRRDFRGADAKPWDPNVLALTRFPDVIALLTDHLDWTESLGTAAALQPDDVAAAIQLLRAKAESVGNLKSTPQQVVTTRVEENTRTIYIAPANPERIYVPVYDSSTVFTTAAVGALAFGTGVLVGSSWNNRWGWNNRRWNTVWVRHYWAPPRHRPPHHGRPGTPPSGPWRPDRPGQRPERPSHRPDRPSNRPDRPGVRPDRPDSRPDRPGVRPDRPSDRPGARPDRPSARPDRPSTRPDRPNARPDRPATRPERPTARPERPAARPERPTARPERPAARPERPAARPQTPSNRPQTRPQNRPQQTRPAQRPQQTRPPARPQQSRPQQTRPRPQARPARPANPPARQPPRPRPGERR